MSATIAVPGNQLITTGMPGSLWSDPVNRDIFLEWVRVTGCVSVTLPTGVTVKRLPVWQENITKLALAGKDAGGAALVVHWGPWNQTAHEDTADYFDDDGKPGIDFFTEREYWLPLLDAALVASRRAGISVVGLMDTELWSTRDDNPAQMALLYRAAESWWYESFPQSPSYWYDFGGVRRQRRTDGLIAVEPNSRFPPGYEPVNAGRPSASVYHLGDPAEFCWRLEETKKKRWNYSLPGEPICGGVWVSLSSSSTDGRAWSSEPWPTKYTRACAEVLGQELEYATHFDRVILWMKKTDWTSQAALRHLHELCDGIV